MTALRNIANVVGLVGCLFLAVAFATGWTP